MAIRVGINGFGRTGRALLRAAARTELDIEVVAVNDLAAPGALARLLARDSVHGRYGAPVSVDGSVMLVGDARITMLSEPDVKALPWSEHQVDVVVECTGRFTAREKAAQHLDAGAPRVVVSAPSKGADATFVMGVNDGLSIQPPTSSSRTPRAPRTVSSPWSRCSTMHSASSVGS